MTIPHDTLDPARQLGHVPLSQGLAADVLARIRGQAHSNATGPVPVDSSRAHTFDGRRSFVAASAEAFQERGGASQRSTAGGVPPRLCGQRRNLDGIPTLSHVIARSLAGPRGSRAGVARR